MRSQRLEELNALIQAVQGRFQLDDQPIVAIDRRAVGDGMGGADSAACGWLSEGGIRGNVRGLIRGLVRGAVHEWFGLADLSQHTDTVQLTKAKLQTPLPRWTPPMGILLHLARCSLEDSSNRCVVWIGKHCWPYPHALMRRDDCQRQLLRHSLFIDCPNQAGRLWAIESAARCPAVAAVIADGSGLVMAHTRRLQLAAEAGSALLLLARPPHELDRLSAAATRWLVSCAPSTRKAPTWNVQLLRCKGLQHGSEVLRHDDGCERRWTMEWNRAQGGVAIHAPLVGRPAPAAQPRPASIRRSA